MAISDGLWRRRFGADPGLLGRAVPLDGRGAVVVGIMPRGFGGLTDAELWVPFSGQAGIGRTDLVEERIARWHQVVGRLKPDVELAAARDEMTAMAKRMEAEYPDTNRTNGALVVPLADDLVGVVRPALLALLGAVGFVLLIACANVANLTLARHAARRREVAVRAAIGAGRGRLVRQLLTESLLLAAFGGLAGLALAAWALELFASLEAIRLPGFVSVELDGRALAAAAGVTLLTGVAFGTLPAWSASGMRLRDALGARPRGDVAASARLRSALVVAEVALALVLLVGAGLMLRSLHALRSMDPGFASEGLTALRVVLPDRGEGDAPGVPARRAEELLRRVRGLAGVEGAALASDLPLGGSWSATIVRIEGRDDATQRGGIRVYRHYVSPGLLDTLGIPLLRGEDFVPGDRRGREAGAVIISRAMARRHFPDEDPLQHHLVYGGRRLRIQGVAGDVKYRTLREAPGADPDVYLPFDLRAGEGFALAVRGPAAPGTLARSVRGELDRLDPEAPVFGVEAFTERLAGQQVGTRFVTALLGAFAFAALSLAVLGLYGVVAYAVGRRVPELGTRMALGATPSDVRGLVLGQSVKLVAAGVSLGLLASLAVARALGSLLVSVPATDLATHLGMGAWLAAVALLASDAPARRAARIDPVEALRSE